MPETGSQILSYQPSAAQGLGANAEIPAINPNSNLDVINQTANQLQLYNHQNNIKLYEQKIADRDATLDLLAKGQIASGNIDPNDRKVYDDAKQGVMDSFHDAIAKGGLLNNPDAYKDYLGKVANLQNVATWAQHRELSLAELEKNKALQTLPEDIAAYDKHLQQQKSKPFWAQIDPFQKAFDYNLGASTNNVLGIPVTESEIGSNGAAGIPTGTTQWKTVTDKNGVITQKQTTKTAPLKSGLITSSARSGKGVSTTGTQVNPDGSISPISYTPDKYWDFPTIQKNVDEQSASNPSERFTYQSYLNDFQSRIPIDQQLSTLKSYNNRIADYSTQRGIQPIGTNEDGTPKYPDQIKFYQDPVSKKVLIQETPESFFAKHALASVNGDYVEKGQSVFNKDIGAYNISKQKANTDEVYKMGMLANARNKTNGYLANLRQQMKFRKDVADQDNLLDELWKRNLVQQSTLIKPEGNNQVSLAPIEAKNSLPVFTIEGKTPKQLIPIDGKPFYSNESYKDNNGVTELKAGAKPLYYEGGHYDPEYLLNGSILKPQQIADFYGQFKRTAGSNWNGSIDDFLKEAVKNNKFEYKLKGANGSTDRGLSLAAQRIISNQDTKKGQTSVFDASNDQPPLDETIQESSSSSENSSNPN